MEESLIYSKNVLEFVTVANEYCAFVERINDLTGKQILNDSHKLLPFLYLKATLLPSVDSKFEEVNEKFVTEDDWQGVFETLQVKLGKHDTYFEVFDPLIHDLDGPATGSIAENMADVYQDLKDFLLLYRIGDEEIMNDAAWECKMNFEQFWGQKLVNALRAIHNSLYNNEQDFEEEDYLPDEQYRQNLDDSIISKRQQEYKKGGKDVFGENSERDVE